MMDVKKFDKKQKSFRPEQDESFKTLRFTTYYCIPSYEFL